MGAHVVVGVVAVVDRDCWLGIDVSRERADVPGVLASALSQSLGRRFDPFRPHAFYPVRRNSPKNPSMRWNRFCPSTVVQSMPTIVSPGVYRRLEMRTDRVDIAFVPGGEKLRRGVVQLCHRDSVGTDPRTSSRSA